MFKYYVIQNAINDSYYESTTYLPEGDTIHQYAYNCLDARMYVRKKEAKQKINSLLEYTKSIESYDVYKIVPIYILEAL